MLIGTLNKLIIELLYFECMETEFFFRQNYFFFLLCLFCISKLRISEARARQKKKKDQKKLPMYLLQLKITELHGRSPCKFLK